MDGDRRNGAPVELIYLPEPSASPALVALGLLGVAAGLFIWWPYGAAGALIALFGLWGWIADARSSFNRLPRHQRVATAPIPAEPLRRS